MTKEELEDIRTAVNDGVFLLPHYATALLAEHDRLALREESLLRQNLAMMRVIAKHQDQLDALQETIRKLQAARIDSRDPREPKCRNLDCWLCHGTPANAGPR
jgi:hypothetical protein